ncbi:HD domain-containing protein [Onishia taeanensis]|uniref:HD domain-containing protein n=1 Tax=Onishia taeanensis TaxID=284577 RepID=A0A1G7RE90_9GAMM|nr:HD domain-containing phosphohydrolase [Halomonas taeanensis]SDG08489.1 HD domain-containing protein [Halomonas taeanensis]
MAETTSEYEPVSSGRDIQDLLDVLSEPGGASLMLDKPGGQPLPVLLMDVRVDEALILDISAIREVAVGLKRGLGFRLLGQARSKLVRTPVLNIAQAYELEGRLLCEVPYPEQLEVLQRRDNFRAELNMSMEATVLLGKAQDREPLQGVLKNLSLEGALVALPLGSGAVLAAASSVIPLKLIFPNGSQLEVSGALRHDQSDHDRQVMLAGFEFIGCSPEQERQLWFFVREIEREAARRSRESASEAGAAKEPSPLFQSSERKPVRAASHQNEYATPMARRLSRLAAYLDNQLFALKQGRNLDSTQLSRHADRLLALLDEDREAVLFALVCMQHESLLVQHGLAVAVRLADIAGQHSMPRDLRKALLACAMVHDLGKALLPDDLRKAASLDQAQYRALQVHVESVMRSLAECNWLSRAVIQAVVGGANERLDGSGYPRGVKSEQLHELTRLMAVVDVVDAMGRERPDRAAWAIDAIYKYLLEQPQLFDQRWVQRYVRHFGVVPIGTLVRYAGGELAWVLRVDAQGQPSRVLLTEHIAAPEPKTLGAMLEGRALAQLGRPTEKLVVPVSD